MALPSVIIFTLGGTIATTAGRGGAAPRLGAKALMGAVPDLKRMARIATRDLHQLPGAHLTLDHVARIATEIRAKGRPAVVTQGTDSIEETAFALDLLVGTALPVVVTGAMRHPGLPGADGPANLLAAVATVTARGVRDLGTLVVMNDTIHAAALVRKTHTSAPDAFASSTAGPIGFVAEGMPHLLLRPAARARLPTPGTSGDARPVPVIASYAGDDGTALRALEGGNLAGVVVAGLGGGHLAPAAADVAARLARRVPVVLASRTGTGAILRATYGYTGSETDLTRRGLISAGWLDAPKARLLLALAQRAGLDRRRLRRAFAAYGGG